MRAVNRRRVEQMVVVASAMVASGACAPASHAATDFAPETFPLVVNNRSDFEVVVYAIPSPGSPGYRLGNARSFATTTMNIPRNALQTPDILVVQLHAIGSSSRLNWTSENASIDHDVVAQLDIRSDGSGNMSRSMLYTQSAALSRRSFGHRQP